MNIITIKVYDVLIEKDDSLPILNALLPMYPRPVAENCLKHVCCESEPVALTTQKTPAY